MSLFKRKNLDADSGQASKRSKTKHWKSRNLHQLKDDLSSGDRVLQVDDPVRQGDPRHEQKSPVQSQLTPCSRTATASTRSSRPRLAISDLPNEILLNIFSKTVDPFALTAKNPSAPNRYIVEPTRVPGALRDSNFMIQCPSGPGRRRRSKFDILHTFSGLDFDERVYQLALLSIKEAYCGTLVDQVCPLLDIVDDTYDVDNINEEVAPRCSLPPPYEEADWLRIQQQTTTIERVDGDILLDDLVLDYSRASFPKLEAIVARAPFYFPHFVAMGCTFPPLKSAVVEPLATQLERAMNATGTHVNGSTCGYGWGRITSSMTFPGIKHVLEVRCDLLVGPKEGSGPGKSTKACIKVELHNAQYTISHVQLDTPGFVRRRGDTMGPHPPRTFH